MQSQTRNTVLFLLSVVLIFGAYSWYRNFRWPPAPKPTRDQIDAAETMSRLLAAPVGTGLGDAVGLAIETAATPASRIDYAIAERAAREAEVAKAAPKPPEPPKPVAPEELVTLGDDDYFLRVRLTPLGAGVDQVVLTRFREADHMGLPAKTPDGQPKPLELIPASTQPSFTLYHYARPDSEEERPLDTLGRRRWVVTERANGDKDQSVSFSTDLPEHGVRLTKTYTLRKREYHVGLTVRIERLPDAKVTGPFRYQLMGGHGLPIEGEWYTTIFRNALFGWTSDNGRRLDRVLEDNRTLDRTSGSQRYQRLDRQIQYAAVAIQYFASAIVVDDEQPKRDFIEFVRATVEDNPDPHRPQNEFVRTAADGKPEPHKPQFDDITVRAIAEAVDPKPGESVEHKYLLYHGPVKVRLLGQLTGERDAVDPNLVERYETALHLNSLTDYGTFSNSTFWSFWTNAIIFFTNLVHGLVGVLRHIVPNEALCIVLVTVIVRGIMFPLSRKQAATMQKTQEQMAKLQPEIKKVKEKYKNDVLGQQQAMSDLYRRHGVNPAAGLGGCLMLFAQMPVFLGLYFALQESFFFRLEPFLWIRNLAAPDMLIWWTEKIPFISDPASQGSIFYLGPYFNLLPVLAITLMMVQSVMTMPPPADEQAEMQQKMMKYMMIFMGLMFYKVPAGLCIYFIASTGWGIAERKLLPKKKPDTTGPASQLAGRPGPGARSKGKSKPDAPPSKLREWWEKVLKEASKK
jgi:YidC/Oxa1 family membrane protein insertase